MTRLSAWTLLPDPSNIGIAERWFDGPRPGAAPAPVPGVIQQVVPDALGVAWYWTTFEVGAIPPDHRLLVHFGGADYLATVWLDGLRIAEHEGVDEAFEADVTELAGRGGRHVLAVRVLHATEERLDGFVIGETAHRNKRSQGYHPGWLHNVGGLTGPVDIQVLPVVRIVDVVARPRLDDGGVAVRITIRNDGAAAVVGTLSVAVGPDRQGCIDDRREIGVQVAPGLSVQDVALVVPAAHPWDLDDPFLYRVTAHLRTLDDGRGSHPLVHDRAVRVGFRDFRVVDGYYRLNGRRLLVRSSHTGNHFPISQVVPPTPDLVRRDLLNAKASGFNMLRFMSGLPLPDQLDCADEIGLLIYEEPMVSWLLQDSDAMVQRYDSALEAMLRRDRNHPSVVIWGLLTEGLDGPVFRHALTTLENIRDLDPTRLVMLNSGRFDAKPAIGSVSNPGGTTWEHTWGNEAPDAPGRDLVPDPATGWLTAASWINGDLSLAGAIDGNGDTHTYPIVPHAQSAIDFLRTLGRDTKPHMLSEYGVGSLMNVIGETRRFEAAGARPDLLDAALIRSMAERFEADLTRYGLDDLYPFPEDLLIDAQRRHARHRELGFDIVRSNPKLAGWNITGLLDHALTGEGFWTFWRQWKPGIVDVLSDGWAPLRWCLFSQPRYVEAGRDLRLEAVLANDDALTPGTYDARFRLSGPSGLAWETTAPILVPPRPDSPLALPALDVVVPAPTVAGTYTFAAELVRGGRPAGGRLAVHVAAPVRGPATPLHVVAFGLAPAATAWLLDHGVAVDPLSATTDASTPTVLVGDPGTDADPAVWARLHRLVTAGATAVFLTPDGPRRGDAPLGWLPLEHGGRCEPFYDWVYHREWVGARHPLLDDVGAVGVLDWDRFGPLLGSRMYEGMPDGAEVAIAAFAVGYSTPGGYASGIVLGAYPSGSGRVVLNALELLPNLDRHPLADRLLMNLIRWAAR